MTFELYDGSNENELRNALKEISDSDTNLYYNSLLFSEVITRESFWNVAHDYYLTMIHKDHDDRFLYMARNSDNELVGICSFRKRNQDVAEGVIYGVRPKFRNKKYASKLLQYSLQTLKNQGVGIFNTEVQLYNYKSVSPHLNEGFKPKGLYLNILLFSFLSEKHKQAEELDLSKESILNWLLDRLLTKTRKTWKLKEMKGDLSILTSSEKVLVYFPIVSETTALIRVSHNSNSIYLLFV